MESLLKKFELLGSLPDAELKLIAAHLEIQEFPPRCRFIETDDETMGIFFIFEGRLKIIRESSDGQEQIIAILDTLESFGEAALFHRGGYAACVETLEKSRLGFLPKERFLDLLQRHPAIGHRIICDLSEKLRQMIAMVDSLALKDARGRVCSYLCELVPEESDASLTVDLPLSRTLMARLLGINGATLSRTLTGLVSDGVLAELHRDRVTILCPRELGELAGS